MNIIPKCLQILLAIFAFSVVSAHSANVTNDYAEIEWTQLMPADDLDALLNPPEFLNDIEDGASNDNIASLSALSRNNESALRFEKALKSTRVIKVFDKARIRLPGFIVPLESDEQQRITEFFIVPYFGACLHLPPPPPNQIIFSQYANGIELANLYDPYWFEGTLLIDQTEKTLGSSAYTLTLDAAYPYRE